MIHTVLDTNVLAGGFFRSRQSSSILGRTLRLWQARAYQLIVSEHIAEELERTFSDPYFRRHFPASEAAASLSSLRSDATFVELTGTVSGVAPHRHDDPVLESAAAGKADYLVTGDAELLALGTYEGVAIVTPRDFLDILDREANEAPEE